MVAFFSSGNPALHTIREVLGFVEELVSFKRSDKEAENMKMI